MSKSNEDVDRTMIYFRSDYSQGAHPEILDALLRTNNEHTDGYGRDIHCEHASEIVKNLIGTHDCEVHMMIGGTSCNVTAITAGLEPYQYVISPKTGHIYAHEAGAVEAAGHRIAPVDTPDGKLTPDMIDKAWEDFEDEHTLIAGMAYISQPTEIGTLYSKDELRALHSKCREKDMLLYIDGARLGVALTCKDNDVALNDYPELCDAFYIGGTKSGLMFGEALVIMSEKMNDHFRWMMRRHTGLLAKGRLIGVQFEALLEGDDPLLYRIGRRENELADRLRTGLDKLGIRMYSESPTNQVFPLIPVEVDEELKKDFFYYDWAPARDGFVPIRLVTSWGTTEGEVDAILKRIGELLHSLPE